MTAILRNAVIIGADFSFSLPIAKDKLPPSPPLLSPSLPLPLEVSPRNTAVSSPSGVWGKGPADERFGAHWVKSAAPVAAVFVDFPKNRCNCLHKNKLDIVRRYTPV